MTRVDLFYAGMAELADAHGSGPCESNFMQVQVLLPAPVWRWIRFLWVQRSFLSFICDRSERLLAYFYCIAVSVLPLDNFVPQLYNTMCSQA